MNNTILKQMLKMTLKKEQNNKSINLDSLSANNHLNESINFENAFVLIHSGNNEHENILDKVKAILNLFLIKDTFEYILEKCFKNDNGGEVIRIGAFDYEEYRITAIHSRAENNETFAILIKHFPIFSYLQNSPNVIRSLSLKRLWVNKNKWENQVLIKIMGNFGREYKVKFNFFAYN